MLLFDVHLYLNELTLITSYSDLLKIFLRFTFKSFYNRMIFTLVIPKILALCNYIQLINNYDIIQKIYINKIIFKCIILYSWI